MNLPSQVNLAIRMLEEAGHEAYLVGGAVRDFVRGCPGNTDWDITTDALPEETEAVFAGFRLIETGLKHGTVTVLMDGVPLEITTFRVDGAYSDHRRPDSVRFTGNLKDDVERRDFTMNALAYNPRTGVVDLVGGQADIAAGLIRCVGDPDRRFREDALRILRALRFASRFEMAIEADTAAAIHRNRELLTAVAAERVRVELTGLLCGRGVAAVLREYADVIAVVLPEITPMIGFWQHNPHHDRDVWEHTLAVVAHSPVSPVMRWAALLHDMGKPHCFTLDEEGVGHFYGHASRSTAFAEDILRRLRFDNAARERISLLVKHHDTPLPADEKGVKRLLNRFGPEMTGQLIDIHRADTAGQPPSCACRYAEFDRVETLMENILAAQACFSLKDLAINGSDIVALGFRGPEVGRQLNACLEAVMDSRVPNEREALLEWIKTP